MAFNFNLLDHRIIAFVNNSQVYFTFIIAKEEAGRSQQRICPVTCSFELDY